MPTAMAGKLKSAWPDPVEVLLCKAAQLTGRQNSP